MRLLQTIGWLACSIYSTIPSFWLMIHTRADYWRSRHTSPYRILIPLWMTMWAIAAAITAPWHRSQLYETKFAWIPAAALFLAGLCLYKESGVNFSPKQLMGLPELRPNHAETRLVTTGIRSRIRHPVYLAHLCEMLAWSVGTRLVVCYALTIFAVITGAIMIRKEDAELEARFGDAYRIYRERVPAILPRPL